jgi:DNA-binding Lrp family transcriptional regulator
MKHLSEKEERILACAQLNADLSIVDIAKITRIPQSQVRALLGRLLDTEVAHKLWYVNPYALGHTLYNLWFTVSAAKSRDRARLEAYMRSSSQVVFFVELAGRFQYSASLQTKSLLELANFLQDLSAKFGACFTEKSTSTILELTDLPLVKRWRPPQASHSITIAVDSPVVPIDEASQAILEQLATNPAASLNEISRALGAPHSTVAYRFNQLRLQGVIAGCRYFIDFLKLGYSFCYHQITLAGANRSESEDLIDFLIKHPAVYFYQRCIGTWDLEVGTVTREHSMQAEFIRTLSDTHGHRIARTESGFVSRFLKLNAVLV